MSSPDLKEINLVRCLKCGKILKCSRYNTAALLEHIRTDHPAIDIIDTDTKQKRTTGTQVTKSPMEQLVDSYRKGSSIVQSGQKAEIDESQCLHASDCAEKCEQHVTNETTEDEERREQWPRQPQYVKDIDLTHYSVTSEILEKYPEIKECEYTPHNPNAQVLYTRRYRVNSPSSVSPSVLQRPFQRTLYRTSIEKWSPANGTIHCPKCGCNKRPLIKTKAEHFTHNECVACCLLSCWPLCFLPWILPRQNKDYLYCGNCKTFLGLYDRNTNCIQPNRLYYSDYYNKDQRPGAEPAQKNWHHFIKQNKMLENESPPQSSAGDSAKSKHLSSIVIDGKELPPETVARIQKYKRFSSLVGLDMDALTSRTDSGNSTRRDDAHQENVVATPSVAKDSGQNVKDSA